MKIERGACLQKKRHLNDDGRQNRGALVFLGTAGRASLAGLVFPSETAPLYEKHMDTRMVRGASTRAGLINPDDARERGIADGDVVRIFNDRGEILAGALITERVRRGVLVVHEGGWYDPGAPGKEGPLCKHGLVNVLTLDKGTSRLAQGNIANTILADVEKFAGEPPEVTAFLPPPLAAMGSGK